ncbi:rSAM/selenodomain-associated transferase 2/rSAM/selenodomain-associated transferase 1 [Natronospira proteinivora]|uniref:RSAM/selenodomain-associated transferase 2/rSAM/selenodomain-associated transferase 1 n=1 Tax=Natronospira proteinivora TaxID=1807133 RepID=A0ABT1G5C0_9GAMM|nr:TIGR04283 family arsenosugar biosynthesis glycosyltransferase [Natronospira proteinivora]MCP1726282.1 rSAM/selenodomain-associated transferase 2/rSAM/selenodomain-associated transferase 1 [Natronospira proteinivora]
MKYPCGMRLTLFSRIPQAGRCKTRLIPKLGAEGAARIHHEMSLRAITHGRLLQHHFPELDFEIAIAGDPDQASHFYGRELRFCAQAGGDLGERMHACFRQGREDGIQRHVLIGSDAPDLDDKQLLAAFEGLADHDLVLGPARDGGYYLIGLSAPPPPLLFQNLPWGSPEILGLTLARAQEEGLALQLLPALDDVDEPADLKHWYDHRRQWPEKADGVSVILPVLDEAEHIGPRIQALREDGADEVIVVDGGSNDDTPDLATQAGARVLHSEPGRARQMNRGARAARHSALLFLHADTALASGWRESLLTALVDPRVVGGAFRFRLDHSAWRYRLLEGLVALRCRLLRRPYGDQGLFCRREAFLRMEGFPEVAVMEDYVFVGRLRREGRLRLLKQAAVSSARNWERVGFWRVTLAHRLMILGHVLGISLDRLARLRQHLLR